jgi:hypothetical protein
LDFTTGVVASVPNAEKQELKNTTGQRIARNALNVGKHGRTPTTGARTAKSVQSVVLPVRMLISGPAANVQNAEKQELKDTTGQRIARNALGVAGPEMKGMIGRRTARNVHGAERPVRMLISGTAVNALNVAEPERRDTTFLMDSFAQNAIV